MYFWRGKGRDIRWGGIAFVFHHSVRFDMIDVPDSYGEILAARVSLNDLCYCFVLVYLPNHRGVSDEILLFRQFMERLPRDEFDEIIIIGDFNSKNILWGDRTDSRGTELAHAVSALNLLSFRLFHPTYLGKLNEQQSYIDCVFTSNLSILKEVRDLVPASKDDHRFLFLSFRILDDP